ncbi:protein LSM14 homolog B [Thalassophryne amazonica]|uniref:protein LSM14 homolog B n=1 Tax=Thalassophryne amazonica TaxID=390379 RepID=UPI0014726054|nr:protein LSM14 homolog B [Thalassophryne amazonica]
MSSAKPYIGCRIGLISKAQNRYEGILYTIDKVNSTVVLAKVKCLGTEGRPTDRPTPPRDDVYDYITFRGSDIKDIVLCEPLRSHSGLPPDPAIIQSSAGSAYVQPHPTVAPFSPVRMPLYNTLGANALINQQYAAALGYAPRQRQGFQEQQGKGATEDWGEKAPKSETRTTPEVSATQQEKSQPKTGNNRPAPTGRQGARRRRVRNRGQLMVPKVPFATLKFDTDFDFDLSNAQFNKEELQREIQDRLKIRDENEEDGELDSDAEANANGLKCYYNKAKSFFDNISSDNFRLTWAEERKRNLETFGVAGRFLKSRGFRSGHTGRRGRGGAIRMPSGRL